MKQRIKLCIFLFCLVSLISCNISPIPVNQKIVQYDQKIFDSFLNKYIKDTLSKQFTNPLTFQLISYSNDTITGSKSDKLMFEMLSESINSNDSQKKFYLADSTLDSIQISKSITELDSQLFQDQNRLKELKSHPTKPDSIIQINVSVNFKFKDKNDKEIYNNLILIYDPKAKTFTDEVDNDE